MPDSNQMWKDMLPQFMKEKSQCQFCSFSCFHRGGIDRHTASVHKVKPQLDIGN